MAFAAPVSGTYPGTEEKPSAQPKSRLAAGARKDARAFRALYDTTSAKLFASALRILVKRELGGDVLQKGFVNVWSSAASYPSSLAPPMAWMTTIVRNKAFDLVRRVDDTVAIDAGIFDKESMEALASACACQNSSHSPPATG